MQVPCPAASLSLDSPRVRRRGERANPRQLKQLDAAQKGVHAPFLYEVNIRQETEEAMNKETVLRSRIRHF